MGIGRWTSGRCLLPAALAGVLAAGSGHLAYGQSANGGTAPADPAAHKGHAHDTQGTSTKGGKGKGAGPGLAAELAQVKEQLSQLRRALERQGMSPGMAAAQLPSGMPGMRSMGMGASPQSPAAGMGMMDDDMMSTSAAGGMGGGMECCDMMGQMGGAGMLSALPGFPGASHIYHIGESGFFLDHPQHVQLSPDQQRTLGSLREQALFAQAEVARKISAAEGELWQLTAADRPSLSKIEAKVREIEKLRGDQRLAFIRAVGEAANVLTDAQRQALLGQVPPMGAAHAGGGMVQGMEEPMPPSGGGGMGDM